MRGRQLTAVGRESRARRLQPCLQGWGEEGRPDPLHLCSVAHAGEGGAPGLGQEVDAPNPTSWPTFVNRRDQNVSEGGHVSR